VGAGGEMTQVLYAHMNNKTIKKSIEIETNMQLRGSKKKKGKKR
jgi:hypothetical protein